MAKKTTTKGVICIDIAPKLKKMKVTVEGTTRFVTNKFPAKAKNSITRKKLGEKVPRQVWDPEREFNEALYVLNGTKKSRYGFPVTGFKAAIASVAKREHDIHKVLIYTNLYIEGEPCTDDDGYGAVDCVEIKGSKPQPRKDVVRLAGIGHPPDIRIRPEFLPPWHVELKITYDSTRLSAETIKMLVAEAGMKVGVGEWRPEKGGTWGTFKVVE